MFFSAKTICLNMASIHSLCSLRTPQWVTGAENLSAVTALNDSYLNNSLCKGVKPSAFVSWRAIELFVMTKVPCLHCNKTGRKTKEERLQLKWTCYLGYYNFPSLLITPVWYPACSSPGPHDTWPDDLWNILFPHQPLEKTSPGSMWRTPNGW